jgi:hypothetical protein
MVMSRKMAPERRVAMVPALKKYPEEGSKQEAVKDEWQLAAAVGRERTGSRRQEAVKK